MEFGYPLALWGAAAIPLIIALNLLARRRRDLFVPSLFIWKRLRADQLQTPAKRRFLFSYNLVFQIVFVAAAVLALADAKIITSQQPPVKRIFVLDRSVSMLSVNVDGTTRLAQAEKRLQELKNKNAQSIVLDSSSYPEDARILAMMVAHAIALVPKDEFGTIDVLSDKIPEVTKNLPLNVNVNVHIFGEQSRNIGILAFDVEHNPDGVSNIYLRVKNYSGQEASVPVKLLINDKEAEIKTLNLKSADEREIVFRSQEKEISAVRCELSVKDDLAFDNVAAGVWTKVPDEISTDITDKNWLRAFRAALGERLTTVADKQAAQIRIVRGVPPENPSPGNIIYFNPSTEKASSVSGKIKLNRPDAPIFNTIGGYWSELTLGNVAKISLPPKFETFATVGENPAVAKFSSADSKAIYLGFDPLQNGFEQSSPSFPLLALGILKEMNLYPAFQTNFQSKPFASDNRLPEVREKSFGHPPNLDKLSQRPVNLRFGLLVLALAALLALVFIGEKQK